MKVALVQPKVFLEREKDVGAAIRLVNNANADIIVFPELYPFFHGSGSEMSKEAVRKKSLIIYGETFDGRNSASLAYPDGTIKRHFKMRLWGNEKYIRGTKLSVFSYRGARFGVLVCADFYGGDLAQMLAKKGAEFIIVISMDCPAYGKIWENDLVYVSRKTNVPIIYANSCTFRKKGRQYGGGRSKVVVPSRKKVSMEQVLSSKAPIFRQKDLVLFEMNDRQGIRIFNFKRKAYSNPTGGMIR